MMIARLRASVLALVAAAIAVPSGVGATVIPVSRSARPLPQIQVRPQPAPVWQAVRTGPHVMYGMITAISGATLTMQRRNGRLIKVNAAAAIAHGDFSAPLFVGKLVSIDGNLVSGVFVASHVFRLSNLNQLPNDR